MTPAARARLRAKRRDAGWATLIIACLAVGMGAVAWVLML